LSTKVTRTVLMPSLSMVWRTLRAVSDACMMAITSLYLCSLAWP